MGGGGERGVNFNYLPAWELALVLFLSYIFFSWFIIFTFRNYFTKSSSAAGRSRHQQLTSANISSRHLVHPAAGDDFVICWNVRVDKCLCCQTDIWHPTADEDFAKLLNSLQNCVCIWRNIFFCHLSFMKKKVILSFLKMNLKISDKVR